MGYYDDINFIAVREVRDYIDIHPSTLRGASFFSLEFVYKGKMTLIMDNREILIESPAAFWLDTKHKYYYRPFQEFPRNQIWTNFIGTRAGKISAELSRQIPDHTVPIHQPEQYYALFQELMQLFEQHNPRNHFRLVVLLERLAGMTIEASQVQRTSRLAESAVIEAIAANIRSEPLLEWDFKSEAKKLKISYSNFRDRFKRFLGFPPYEFLLRCRMAYAANLLAKGAMSVKETAYECGFNDLSSFSRLFKKKIGVSPREYYRSLSSI